MGFLVLSRAASASAASVRRKKGIWRADPFVPSILIMALFGWAEGLRQLFGGERRRGISVVGARAYVEFKGVSADRLARFAELVEDEATVFSNLAELGVEPLTRRVMFRFAGDVPSEVALDRVVARAEERIGLSPQDVFERDRALPDDLELDQIISTEAAADLISLLTGMGLSIVPFFPRGLGANLYGLVFLTQHLELLREPIERRFGKDRTELALNLAGAFSQALAQRPLSSLVDLTARVANLRELRERRGLWERWAPILTEHDHAHSPIASDPRPCELPKGPIERHNERAWMVAMGTFGVGLITTRSPSRAFAAAFAALPQPARLGREIYASELGRVFARRGMLVLSTKALRRLDRVNCLVLPAELVTREQFMIGDVFGLRGISRAQALTLARRLFASDRPLRVHSEGGYSLGPVRLLPCALDAEREVAMAERAQRGELVLGISQGERLLGLVDVRISPQSGVLEAVQAARKAGMHIVYASDDVEAAEAKEPDDVISLSRGLAQGIRRLQEEGRVVCFIGRGPSEGYAAADFGVALCVREHATPWGAHLLCPDDARLVETVVAASANARAVSEQSVRTAMVAAAMGTLVSTGGVASRRVMFVLNSASLFAMGNALRRSAAVGHATRKHTDPTPWHALEARGVMARLGTREEGLPERPAVTRTRTLVDTAWVSELGAAVRSELMSPLSPLLAVGAGVSAMVGSMADAGIVASVGSINAFIGGYQRFRTERAISNLVQSAETRVRVRRAGRVREIPASELVRGDLVLFAQGDVVPADCRIIESSSLEVDASSLTGESLPVLKGPSASFAESTADVTSMLYAATTIAGGRATAVVVATGDETVARRAAAAMPDEARGGVEARLRELMRLTGPVAVAAGAALVTAGMLRGRRVDDLVSTGVGLAVAAVPEGLPVLATAAQLSAAERLSRKGALVKNARAIEALGRVNVLCMDKTGTLTEGRIELSAVFDGQSAGELTQLSDAQRAVLDVARLAMVRAPSVFVDPIDAALLLGARHVFGSESVPELVTLGEQAFESGRGFEAVLARHSGPDSAGDSRPLSGLPLSGAVLFVKGAPEEVMDRAERAHVGSDIVAMVTARRRFQEALSELTRRGLRVIAVAERSVQDSELEDAQVLLANPGRLTLRGFVAFRDPLRASARLGVQGLARAGVRSVMITGDHPNTAETIAREVGLAEPDHILHGTQIAQLTEPQLEQAVRRTSVFARVTPSQKVRIVRAFQRAGFVVGMVGDGANDAPAMRVADAGVAVGTNATEAARAAADLVLADARIDILVEAVVEGRAMWSAVRDAVSILVGGNLGEIAFTVGVGGLTGRPPLSPRQLLLVNFLTDIAPSMAIALRAPDAKNLDLLRETGPEAALGAALNREIISRAITTGLGAGTAWTIGRLTGGSTRARTIGLVGLVGTQLGQTLRSGGSTSRSVFWTSIGSGLALGFVVQMPGLSQLFGCTPLGPIAWTTALSSATAATLISPFVDGALERIEKLIHSARGTTPEVSVITVEGEPVSEPAVIAPGAPALRLLRN
jgi:cation-transporting ATPase I